MKFRYYIFFATICSAYAQISIVDSGATGNQIQLGQNYTQNFDSLASSGSSHPWVNNVTLPGWFSNNSSYTTRGGVLGSYGSGTQSDRALGGIYTLLALSFSNQTSATITKIDLSYTGEQWLIFSNASNLPDKILFQYQIFASGSGSISADSWIADSELNFHAPNIPPNTTALLDGNASENRSFISGQLTGVNLLPNQEIWFRWSIEDDLAFNDYDLAIDDLSINFASIPEPASASCFFGLVAIFLALRSRRSREI